MRLLGDFHLLRPWWMLALALLPLAWIAMRHSRSEGGAWRTMVDAHLLPFLLDGTTERARSGGVWLGATVWVLACIALSGPSWERETLPLYRNEAARVLAIELAPTMLAADLKPTRLERARYKINDILVASRDMQTALIGYAGDAFVAAPLTDDINTVRNLVDALDPAVMPVVGNATDRAIEEAQRLVEQAGLKRGELIVLADSAGPRALAAARAAHAKGLTISVLGVGTTTGAPVPLPQGGFLQDANGGIVLPRLDEAGLRALAAAGGGRYATLSPDRADIDALLAGAIAQAGSAPSDEKGALSDRFRDRGPWFVLALLPLALIAFRRGWLVVLALVLVPMPKAQAFSFADLWQRPDQQAAAALAAGDVARAQQLARDPALRGSAAYRAGDFDAANKAYEQSEGVDAQYNSGNALAKLGKYEDALAAYDRALAANPDMQDAKANRQAVEEWLKREQSKKDDKKEGENKDDKNKDENSKGEQQKNDGEQKPGDSSDPQKSDAQQGGEQQKDPSDGERKDQQSGQPGDKADDDKHDADGKDAKEQEADAKERERQQQALSKQIDQALDKPPGEQPPQQALSPEEESAREQQQALNQWLQRVPDDPGGLLRRKFQLEYERRQRGRGGQ